MEAILGVDAAWTEGEPSGVALIEGEGEVWRALAVAPSYASFIGLCESGGEEKPKGVAVDWGAARFAGQWPCVAEWVEAASRLTASPVRVVAVDMPLSTVAFSTRREADNAISRVYGGRGCSTHSPSAERPGELGASLMAQLEEGGFALATTKPTRQGGAHSLEVYPHPALLELMGRDYRVPYKVSRSSSYWKGETVSTRIAHLLAEFTQIRAGLEAKLGPIPLVLPKPADVQTLSSLKRFEDALDALVCAWVGACYARGAATAFGNETAAIWVPTAR
jgi:predicted RNase H-like nuclease